jgi:hypothetical protein
MWVISRVAEQLVAAQEGLIFMVLVHLGDPSLENICSFLYFNKTIQGGQVTNNTHFYMFLILRILSLQITAGNLTLVFLVPIFLHAVKQQFTSCFSLT